VFRHAIALLIACHVDAPAQPATCAMMADHVFSLLEPKDARARSVRDTFEHRCDIDRWSEVARSCVAEEPSLGSGSHCKEHLTGVQRERIDAALGVAASRPARVHPLVGPCDEPGIDDNCADYCRAIFRLATCERVPEPTREGLRRQWEAIRGQLASFAASCASAASGMQQIGQAYGC